MDKIVVMVRNIPAALWSEAREAACQLISIEYGWTGCSPGNLDFQRAAAGICERLGENWNCFATFSRKTPFQSLQSWRERPRQNEIRTAARKNSKEPFNTDQPDGFDPLVERIRGTTPITRRHPVGTCISPYQKIITFASLI
jgi:hypothetical protein